MENQSATNHEHILSEEHAITQDIQRSMENQSVTSDEHIPNEEHPFTRTQLKDLAISISEKLEGLSRLSPNCCIYRVNSMLRKVNQKAYTPMMVSVGPHHRAKTELQTMEEHKLRYLQTFLQLTSLSIGHCVNLVRTWETEARSCYAENIEQTSDEFAEMILVDGCFVVMVLVLDYFPQLIPKGDRIFHKPYLGTEVLIDMALLENQLPFFVIERLYTLVSASINQTKLVLNLPSIWDLVNKFFKPFISVHKPSKDNIFRVSHFVDLIRLSYEPTPQQLDPSPLSLSYNPKSQPLGSKSKKIQLSSNATHLHEAGVKFVGVTKSSPMDIEFVDGVLKIPQLTIDDSSEIIFRNLVAFEQLHSSDDEYITAYLWFFDKLIDTPHDVDLLVKGGVIDNFLGSNEDVCNLFNNICKNTNEASMPYFRGISEDLNAYCKTPWHKWKVILKHDYLDTPWKVMGIIVAFLILLLTFTQTVCSILSL